MSAKDTLFKGYESPKEFVFDARVAEVFDDMIARSVPHYLEVQESSVEVAKRFVRPGSLVVDLGCSTGTTLALLARAVSDPSVKMLGVDNTEAMLEKCRHKIAALGCSDRIALRRADLESFKPERCSVAIMFYTLQFLAPEMRADFVNRVYHSLEPGGAFLLTEKFSHRDPLLGSLMIDLYHDFKRRNGYSDEEIQRKREALENVLIPFSENENMDLLKCAGFERIELFLKRYNFGSFLAVKRK